MSFSKYSAIYKNSNLIIDNETVIGTINDIKEYFRYELASQCMSMDVDDENLKINADLIFDLFDKLPQISTTRIKVSYHPMGALMYEIL